MISQHHLKRCVHYDPVTGVFTWLVNMDKNRRIGDVIGTVHTDGYLMSNIKGSQYLLHRLAFLYMDGEIPNQVDHKDENKVNNAWSNLRPTNHSLNQLNISNRAKRMMYDTPCTTNRV